ncbi:MAG: EutN/CcmL family microcompartment protein [Hungatella hathewayi]
MILGTVKGTVVSTRKMDNLVGYKFLLVEPYFGDQSKIIVAGDTIGAGIGELVLVTTDETTQHALTREAPVWTRLSLGSWITRRLLGNSRPGGSGYEYHHRRVTRYVRRIKNYGRRQGGGGGL